jgi:hypothetical protein
MREVIVGSYVKENKLVSYRSYYLKWRRRTFVVMGLILKRIGMVKSTYIYTKCNTFEKCLMRIYR